MTLADRSRPTHRTRPTNLAAPRAGTAGHQAARTRTPRLRIVVGGANTAPAPRPDAIHPDAIPWNVYARERAFPPSAAPSRPTVSLEVAETAEPSRSSEQSEGSGAAAYFWFDWFPMLFLGALSLASGFLSIVMAIAR